MDPRRTLPASFVQTALEFTQGRRRPVQPKDAATVVLMRKGTTGGPEVYLLRRQAGMAFAGGACVFPGGGVDPRDFDSQIAWAGPTAAQWGTLLRADEATARALVCAAVRETFEESGVLLAGPTADTVVADTTAADWEEDRHALEARELAFTDFLHRRGLALRTDLLRLWGTWVTPEFEPRRFNTRFFVAELPTGQVTRDVSTESDEVVWMSAADAVAASDDGRMSMLPPTYCTCMEILECGSTAGVLAAAGDRDLDPVQPTFVVADDGTGYLDLPARLVDLGARVAAR